MAIIVTAFGHDKTIDKITINLFEESNAETYCETINSLQLKDDSWVFAKKISEGSQFSLDAFIPADFSTIIKKMDNGAIQTALREIDTRILAMSLKDQDEEVREKIFINMSKRASIMLKEEMEYIKSVRTADIKAIQEKIISVIRHLEECGKIIIQQ
ncbi:MAG: hypothetical protein LBG94_00595 [Treponema sp.]|jgi:Mg/Co/Ni transporter MgtE|nr:hypothetical protein [Treponema sp.]